MTKIIKALHLFKKYFKVKICNLTLLQNFI